MRMKHTNLLKRSHKGYTQMFTRVRDPGHQDAQSYNHVAPAMTAIALDLARQQTTASAVIVRARWLRPGDPL